MFDSLESNIETTDTRLEKAKEKFKNKPFSRKAYMQVFKNISTATASRDLRLGVTKNLLKKTGDKNTTRYQFYDDLDYNFLPANE